MEWTSVLSSAVGLISSLAGAGPWGLAAMGVGAGGLVYLAYYLINKNNERVDRGDMARAGADAGRTAQDLRKQAKFVNDEIERLTQDELEKNEPGS